MGTKNNDFFADLLPVKPSQPAVFSNDAVLPAEVEPFLSFDGQADSDQASASGSLPKQSTPMGEPKFKKDAREYELITQAVVESTMRRFSESLQTILEDISSRLEGLESKAESLGQSLAEFKQVETVREEGQRERFNAVDKSLKEVSRGIQLVRDKQEILESNAELAARLLQKDSAQQQAPLPAKPQQEPAPAPVAPVAPPQQQQPEAPPSAPQAPSAPLAPAASLTPPPAPQPQATPPPPQAPPQVPQEPQRQYSAPPPPVQQSLPPPPPPQPQQQPPQQVYSAPPPPMQPAPQYAPMPQMGYSAAQYSTGPPQPPIQLVQSAPGPPPPPPPPMQEMGQYGAPPQQQQQQGRQQGPPPPPPPSFPAYGAAPPQPYRGPQSQGGYPVLPPPQALSPPYGGSMGGFQGGQGQGPPGGMHPARMGPPRPASPPGGSGSPAAPQTRAVPLEKVIDDVANMGFSRHEVRGVVTRLMDSGQNIDLNIVLDRLMNGERG